MADPAGVLRRVGTALAVVALAVLAACGDDENPTVSGGQPSSTTTVAGATTPTTAGGAAATTTTASTGTVLAATVRGGQVVEGGSRQRATLNQPVTIRITSDAADEVHVHGYDKRVEVAAGRTAEVTFVANIPGVFEVEFERSHRLLFTMEVR